MKATINNLKIKYIDDVISVYGNYWFKRGVSENYYINLEKKIRSIHDIEKHIREFDFDGEYIIFYEMKDFFVIFRSHMDSFGIYWYQEADTGEILCRTIFLN